METLTIRSRSQDAVALWTKRITECKNSGMRAGDWCAENGINVKTYYYWHNKIHKMVDQQNSFYEIPAISGNHGVPAATAISGNHGVPAATIRVGIIQADIYPGANAGLIQALCRAMKAC